jgi:hypothetical protein
LNPGDITEPDREKANIGVVLLAAARQQYRYDNTEQWLNILKNLMLFSVA